MLCSVKDLLTNQRHMAIGNEDPLLRRLFTGLFAFEADPVGFSLRDMAQIDHILQDAAYANRSPLFPFGIPVGIQVRMLPATVNRRRRLPARVQQACNFRRTPARCCPYKDLPHDRGGPLVWNQVVFVCCVFLIPVRREIADKLSCLHFDMQRATNFTAGIAGVHFIDDVAERRKVGI